MEKSEIIAARLGGLGSSDAKMVASVGRNKALTKTATDRISVMMGMEEKKQFSTEATAKGDYIESAVFWHLKRIYPDLVNNPRYTSDPLTAKYGFSVFTHIDFELSTDDRLIWMECKATTESLDKTKQTYKDQLNWHWMLLKEKAANLGVTPELWLVHYDTNTTGYFNPSAMTIQPLSLRSGSEILLEGLSFISDALLDFKKDDSADVTVESLPVEYNNMVTVVAGYMREIKEREAAVEVFKERLRDMMVEKGIKSIKNDSFSVVLIPETVSTTFDSKKLQAENPSVYEKYTKQTKKKAYIKFNVK